MSEDADSVSPWRDAMSAAQAFAVAPEAFGGIRLLSPAGPVRDLYVDVLIKALGDGVAVRRVPVSTSEDALHGATDLAATLDAGRLVRSAGLLASDQALLLLLPMAERLGRGLAGSIARALDVASDPPLFALALDESRGPDEHLPVVLGERLGLVVDLTAFASQQSAPQLLTSDRLAEARGLFASVVVPDDALAALEQAARVLGIPSLRPILFAAALARASAALAGRSAVDQDDLAFAARFVLGPRATIVPSSEPEVSTGEDSRPPDQEPGTQHPSEQVREPSPSAQQMEALEDLVVAAARTSLPATLMNAANGAARTSRRREGKAGATQTSKRRGRPLSSRPGRLSDGRLDLLATLKAAAPWQKVRSRSLRRKRLALRRSDIHIRRMRERTERLTIFVVDASGSTAAQRLAEAKGAVELLLAQCYVQRDQVALIVFRKSEASVVLPPTRSLARAKRLLSELPGGGGTPLASAISVAADLAETSSRAGLSPLIVFLTDGSANITRGGAPDRPIAEQEARLVARSAGSLGHRSLLIDVSFRDRPFTHEIANLLGARHVSLPRADAHALAQAVTALGGRS